MSNSQPVLTQDALDAIEQIVCKAKDDMAVSICRHFERLEDQIDAVQSFLYGRIVELQESIQEQSAKST